MTVCLVFASGQNAIGCYKMFCPEVLRTIAGNLGWLGGQESSDFLEVGIWQPVCLSPVTMGLLKNQQLNITILILL